MLIKQKELHIASEKLFNISYQIAHEKLVILFKNKDKVTTLLVACSILIVSISMITSLVSIINYQRHAPFGLWKKSTWIYYDNKVIPAMLRISDLVPQNKPIVISYKFSEAIYFIKHQLIIPYVYSERSLSGYMAKNNLAYLLVLENFSSQKALKKLFSSTGLKNLDTNFHEIANYTTANHYKFHLYQRKSFW